MKRLGILLDDFLHRRNLLTQLIDLAGVAFDGVIGAVVLLLQNILLRGCGL